MRKLVVRSMMLILGSVLALAAQSTSLPTFWRYSHPDARVLAGLDVKRLMESPLGQRMAFEFRQAGFTSKANSEGFQFLSEVERVLISSTGAPASGDKEQPPAVITLQGKFDLAKIRAFVKAKGAKRAFHHKVEILTPEEGSAGDAKQMCLALVSPQTLLAGDRPSVRAALDHHASADPTASTNPLYTRAVTLATVHDVWFVSEASPSEFSNPGPGSLSGPMAMFAEVESFEGGASFQRGLGLELNLNTASSESAEKMAVGLQALLAMFAMAPQEQQGPGSPAELLKKVTVAYDAAQVKLALSFDQAELDRGIESAKVALLRGVTGAVASAPGTPSSEALLPQPEPRTEPSRPMVIKVYNADGGTREIPLNPR